MDFKKKVPFEDRLKESERIMAKYPDRIPIIVEKLKNSNAPDIGKHKYLVPDDLTISQFMYVIRKRIKLGPEEAIYIYVNKSLPPGSSLISQIYKDNKSKCGFLFVEYCCENTFG